MSRLSLSLGLVLLASGCSLVVTYPTPVDESGELCANRIDDDGDGLVDCDDVALCAHASGCEETGALACADGRDNDRDGRIDCADEGCPSCGEDDPATCYDGLDDDGDGYVDARDPGCWPLRTPTLTRCASVAPISAVWSFGGATGIVPGAGAAWYQGGDAYTYGDATGLIFYPLTDDGIGVLAPRSPFALRATHTHAEIEVTTDDTTGAVWLALVPEPLAPVGARPVPGADTQDIAVIVDYRAAELRVRAPGGTRSTAFSTIGRIRLAVDVLDGAVSVTAASSTTTATPTTLGGVASLDTPGDVRFVLGVDGGATVHEAGYASDGEDPCGHPVPEIPGAAGRVGDLAGTLDVGLTTAVAHGVDGLCVLATSCERTGVEPTRTIGAWWSPNGVDWQRQVSPIEPRAGRHLVGAGIAWDPLESRYRIAVASVAAGQALAEIEIGSGYFCGEWDPLAPSGLAPAPLDDDGSVCGVRGASLSYVLRGEPTRHEIWVSTTLSGLLRAESSDGGSFFWGSPAPGQSVLAGPIAVFELDQTLARMRPAPLGVVVPSLVLETSTDGVTWASVGGTSPGLLAASGLPATFDADAPISGVVVDADDGLHVVYGARGDFVPRGTDGSGFSAIGTALLVPEPAR